MFSRCSYAPLVLIPGLATPGFQEGLELAVVQCEEVVGRFVLLGHVAPWVLEMQVCHFHQLEGFLYPLFLRHLCCKPWK